MTREIEKELSGELEEWNGSMEGIEGLDTYIVNLTSKVLIIQSNFK